MKMVFGWKSRLWLISCLLVTSFGVASPSFAKKVLEELKEKISSNPRDADAYYNLGIYYYQNNDFNNCIEPLHKTLELKPKDEDANLLLGSVYLQLGKLPEAERAFLKTLEINSKNVDANNNLSLVYFNSKRNSQAIACLQENLRNDPENVETLNNLGLIYSKMGRFDDAINQYKRLLRINPKVAQTYHRLAFLYFQQQNYDEIIRMYHQAKSDIPENSTTLSNLGFANLYKGSIKEAYQNFNQANQINPGDPEIHYGLGLIAYKSADLDIALQELKQAVKLRPSYVDAMLQLAMTYEDQGEYIKALAYYYQIKKISPDNAVARQNYESLRGKAIDYYLRKGSNAYFNGEYQQAITFWGDVKKLDPANANALKFIQTAEMKLQEKVKVHMDLGESSNSPQDAYREYSTALKLDPNNKRAMEALDKIKKDKNGLTAEQIKTANLKTALPEFKTTKSTGALPIAASSKGKSEAKSATEQAYRKGMKLFSEGKLREAIENLEQAQEQDPSDQGIKNLLYKARTQLRENIKALMARGIELQSSGRGGEAKEKFAEVLKLDPDNQEANERITKASGGTKTVASANKEAIKKLYYDGVSLYLDGQNRKAIEVWQKILSMDPDNQEAKSSIVKAEMELKEMEKRGIQTE
jgi:tetratricopeptide (TPR) repeat protein